MRGIVVIFGVVLACAAPVALAQATKPVESAYESTAIPARHVATTQAASVTMTGGSADVFDTKRMGLALAIVLVAIFVSHRVWKRLGMPGAGGKLGGALQIVSRLSVSL